LKIVSAIPVNATVFTTLENGVLAREFFMNFLKLILLSFVVDFYPFINT